MMLSYFLRLALHVTEENPAYAHDHATILAHYQENQQDLLQLMRKYAYHNENKCWKQYFGITIAFHSMYGLLRLEENSAFKTALQQDVLANRMWSLVSGHKNPYYNYVAATHGPKGLVKPTEITATNEQLDGFGPPPKARLALDNKDKYPSHPDCPGKSTVPIDVRHRAPSDFLWQHHPFQIEITNPEPRLVYSGADYLLAYWLGRYYGHLADDVPNTCTRWDGSP